MELFWIRGAVALYGLASLCALPAVLWSRARFRMVTMGATLAAVVLQCVSVAELIASTHPHHWAPTNVHEVQASLGLLIAGVFLWIAARYRTMSFGIFALPLAFLLLLPSGLGADHYTFSSPLVRGGWIAVHVASLLAAYTSLAFSLLASSLYFTQERRLKRKDSPGFVAWLPPLDTMDRIAQTTLVMGFVCMTVGLFAGSLIAQERVGPTYFEDPKVLLSFAMWLVYGMILLFRQSKGLRGRQAMLVSAMACLLVLSVWAANLLSSVHRFSAR